METIACLRIRAIGDAELEGVRKSGVDVAGEAVVRITAGGGEPVRCCLRNAAAGDELILFGYQPAIPAGPYREIGPVFVHADSCEGLASDEYPADWLDRPQVLRAYDARGWIHPATGVHDGTDPVAAIEAVLAEPGVAQVHSRNTAYGCYMFRVEAPAG